MAKIKKQYRIDEKIIEVLKRLSSNGNMTTTIELLIFKEGLKTLDYDELKEIFGDDFKKMLMLYSLKMENK